MKIISHLVFLTAILFITHFANSQTVSLPESSQKAGVSQRIGLTDIQIYYNRPAVRNRKIWGELIPYKQVWRAGANYNTTIQFSHDVKIEGKDLKAGIYGLHTIPDQNEWTIIFSANSTSWGSEFYKPEEDVLRVQVKPQSAEHQEFLQFDFSEVNSNSTIINLRWEKIKVPCKVELDVHKIVLNNARNELRSLPGFSWQGWHSAAAYCLQNDINLEEALKWIDQSIQNEENFTNLSTKAQILTKLGKNTEVDNIMKKALPLGRPLEVHTYGRQLIIQKRPKEALEVFQANAKKFPKQWPVNWGLARGYAANGNFKEALKFAKLALNEAPDELNKTNIQRSITQLEAGKDIN
jgi:tetratricopeptide (TPR) repeat protein